MQKTHPERLYKYRDFSDRTVQMLISDVLFFADPSDFNDPLDTKPCLDADIENQRLKDLLGNLVSQRQKAEMEAAANSLKYKGPKTKAHIFKQSASAANQAISHILYNASNLDCDDTDALKMHLAAEIERELLERYDAGIFSLAESSICPLMWSHYGDQHKGICLGYSVPSSSSDDVRKVEYGKDRLVRASDAMAMLTGDSKAKRNVEDAVLLRKAPDWKYEREWRLIGQKGLHRSPLELEEVIFGLRCSTGVIFSLTKALGGRRKAVKFYKIQEQKPSFELVKVEADLEEMHARFPWRSLDVEDAFRSVKVLPVK